MITDRPRYKIVVPWGEPSDFMGNACTIEMNGVQYAIERRTVFIGAFGGWVFEARKPSGRDPRMVVAAARSYRILRNKLARLPEQKPMTRYNDCDRQRAACQSMGTNQCAAICLSSMTTMALGECLYRSQVWPLKAIRKELERRPDGPLRPMFVTKEQARPAQKAIREGDLI